MSDVEGVEKVEDSILINVVDFVEQSLEKLVIDPTEFDQSKKKLEEWTCWKLFGSSDGYDKAAREDAHKRIEGEGLIILDPTKDPDPFGNHGYSIQVRLAAMGWPASVPLYLERVEPYRAEDLL